MNPTKNISLLAILFCVMFVFIDAVQAQDADKLYPRSGVTITGKILDVSRDSVVMEVRGNKQNFPTNDILRIVYEGEPSKMSRMKESVANGQWDQAIDSLKGIDAKSIEREETKKDYEFYFAYLQAKYATMGQGDAGKAASRLLAWIKTDPQSYHFYDSSEMLGQLASTMGKYDAAATYFGAMGGSKVPEIQTRGKFLLGSALLNQDKNANAKAAFQEVANSNADSAEGKKLQKMAKVAIYRCDLADGKAKEAIEELNKLVAESDSADSVIMGSIYNVLGEAYIKAGSNIEATLAFLHTDLLFASEPETHAQALYELSKLFTAIGEPQKGADAKARLQSQYSGSPWAKK